MIQKFINHDLSQHRESSQYIVRFVVIKLEFKYNTHFMRFDYGASSRLNAKANFLASKKIDVQF